MSDNPYKGPRGPRRGPPPAARDGGQRKQDARDPSDRREPHATTEPAPEAPVPRKNADEVRLHGLNACRAAFAARPQDLRKVYLAESRMRDLRDVLAWCVKHRLGYRVVETDDLDRLAASTHHEGVVFDLRRAPTPTLPQLIEGLGAGPQVLLWLDGVGNPHNFGAVLRSAAHFGAAGVLLPPGSPLTLSGAAARVAEGGAEFVPAVALSSIDEALGTLRAAGFAIAATVPREAMPLYATGLPERLVLVLGAEGEGMSEALLRAATLRLAIPGTGRVESLNIANAAAVLLGEWWRRHRA